MSNNPQTKTHKVLIERIGLGLEMQWRYATAGDGPPCDPESFVRERYPKADRHFVIDTICFAHAHARRMEEIHREELARIEAGAAALSLTLMDYQRRTGGARG